MKNFHDRSRRAARLLLPCLVALSAYSFAGTPAKAQSSTTPTLRAAKKPPFAEAAATWHELRALLKDLRQTVRDGRLDEVHALAFNIRDEVRLLPDRSGALPAASRLKLSAQVRRVDQLAEALDRAGDSGDKAGTTRHLQSLIGVLAGVEKLYPKGSLVAVAANAAPSKERLLYLTPGGAYTAEDIKANGNQLPAQKFRGVKVNHDLKPAVGDRICPVTLTKANPGYAWTIGGKVYLFCCPPCLEEFLTKAKEDPASLLPPDHYIKRAG